MSKRRISVGDILRDGLPPEMLSSEVVAEIRRLNPPHFYVHPRPYEVPPPDPAPPCQRCALAFGDKIHAP